MHPTIAYLAEGKLYLKKPGAEPVPVDSPFVQQMLDRAERGRQRNEWKGGGGMAWNLNAAGRGPWNMQGFAPADIRHVRFTGVAPGREAGQLLYALDTTNVGGLFEYNTGEQLERRIYHRNQFRSSGLDRHPQTQSLVLSLAAEDGTAHIGVMDAEGRGLKEVTEGDCVDEQPRFVESTGEQRIVVFQSAGVGRNQAGMPIALGPYAIQKLNLDGNEFVTLIEEDEHDCLVPHLAADGNLYFIRRPYEGGQSHVSPWKVALDVLLFPIRVIIAIVHFLNWFSQVFTRKPLMTAGGPDREGPDARFMMLWGKMIDAEKMMRKGKDGDARSLVPDTWQLVRRQTSDGSEEVLASGALSFAVAPDKSVIYTNGSAVFRRDASGVSEKLCTGKLIQHVNVV